VTEQWVLNASPLIVLARVGQEHLLHTLADEVVVPLVRRIPLRCQLSTVPPTLSIIEFLRLAWREEPPPARDVTITGLDTLLASIPQDEQKRVARFI